MEHQHRYRPTGTFASGSRIVYERFACSCGSTSYCTPGIPERDWKWKYLTGVGIRREWKKRCV